MMIAAAVLLYLFVCIDMYLFFGQRISHQNMLMLSVYPGDTCGFGLVVKGGVKGAA